MLDSHSGLAAIVYESDERPDGLLGAFAAKIAARGLKPAGLIQTNDGSGALSVRLLPAAEPMLIGESRGPGARGCILDVGRLLEAGMRVSEVLKDGADVLIVNRFGKQEAEGKGLIFLIEEAMALQIPVVIAVARSRWDAWISFSQGMSVLVPSDLESLLTWWDAMSAPSNRRYAAISGEESDAVLAH